MKIQVISDIHAEFHFDRGVSFWKNIPVNGDVLVIAGDLGTHSYLVENLSAAAEKFPHVVYVTGNHEYWEANGRHVIKAALDDVAEKYDNFHWLFDSVVEIGGVRFLGNTMWFRGDELARVYEHLWADFHRIKQGREWIYRANEQTRFFLDENVRKGDVVVTHHLPCSQSIHPRFKGTPTDWMNSFFLCDISDLILDKEPAAHIHGHTHDHNDYTLGKTRIVSNPYGYIGYEKVENCDLGFCFEVTP